MKYKEVRIITFNAAETHDVFAFANLNGAELSTEQLAAFSTALGELPLGQTFQLKNIQDDVIQETEVIRRITRDEFELEQHRIIFNFDPNDPEASL